jgi:hypothetical protein
MAPFVRSLAINTSPRPCEYRLSSTFISPSKTLINRLKTVYQEAHFSLHRPSSIFYTTGELLAILVWPYVALTRHVRSFARKKC